MNLDDLTGALYLSLHTENPMDFPAHGQETAEVKYPGYARVRAPRDQLHWKIEDGRATNRIEFAWPECSHEAMLQVTHIGIGTQAQGPGPLIAVQDLSRDLFVAKGVTPHLLPNGLDLSFGMADDPDDPDDPSTPEQFDRLFAMLEEHGRLLRAQVGTPIDVPLTVPAPSSSEDWWDGVRVGLSIIDTAIELANRQKHRAPVPASLFNVTCTSALAAEGFSIDVAIGQAPCQMSATEPGIDPDSLRPSGVVTAGPTPRTFQPMKTAPTDRKVLVWNCVTGTYISKLTGGDWPMVGWDGQKGVWYPRPSLWAELPQPTLQEQGLQWNEAELAGTMDPHPRPPEHLDYPGSDLDLMRDVYMTTTQRAAFNRLLGLERERDNEVIKLTLPEVLSGHDRVTQAEALIEQLPDNHEGRNTWLLNYGKGVEALKVRGIHQARAAGFKARVDGMAAAARYTPPRD